MAQQPKTKAYIPKMPKKEDKVAKESSGTKRSVVVHKTEKPVEDMYQMLGQVEKTIEELSRMYVELPDSKHKGVSGTMKPTLKQQTIAEQLKRAQARADRLMKMIEKSVGG